MSSEGRRWVLWPGEAAMAMRGRRNIDDGDVRGHARRDRDGSGSQPAAGQGHGGGDVKDSSWWWWWWWRSGGVQAWRAGVVTWEAGRGCPS